MRTITCNRCQALFRPSVQLEKKRPENEASYAHARTHHSMHIHPCPGPQFRVEEQYGRLENATQDSPQFDAFDLNIVSLIVRLLSEDPQVVTNTVVSREAISVLYAYVLACDQICMCVFVCSTKRTLQRPTVTCY